MGKLHIPGVGEIEVKPQSPEQQAMQQGFQVLINQLGGVINQLDILVRLACENKTKDEVNDRIRAGDAARAQAMIEGQS